MTSPGRGREGPGADASVELAAQAEVRGTIHRLAVQVVVSPRTPGRLDLERLRGELSFIARAAAFDDPGELASALVAWLAVDPGGEAGRPAFAHAEARIATIEGELLGSAARSAGEVELVTEVKHFGFVDVIWENGRSGVYRERIHPGTVLPTHVHHHLSEMELVLDAGLLSQGRPARPGTAFTWPKQHPHRWENPTGRHQAFLCVDRPAFIPTDEVEVEVPTEELAFSSTSRFF